MAEDFMDTDSANRPTKDETLNAFSFDDQCLKKVKVGEKTVELKGDNSTLSHPELQTMKDSEKKCIEKDFPVPNTNPPLHALVHRSFSNGSNKPFLNVGHISPILTKDKANNSVNVGTATRPTIQKSAFRRKLNMPSCNNGFGNMVDTLAKDENLLKRCNSFPLLNEISDHEDYIMPWTTTPSTSASRFRRFSATVVSANMSAANTIIKPSSRLNQLKKEESLEAIQNKETAREKEVQEAMAMNSTCEELSLNDSLNSGTSSNGDNNEHQTKFIPYKNNITSPQPAKFPSSRSIDFSKVTSPSASIPIPHYPSSSIPSPLLIHPFGHTITTMPPSPTRCMSYQSKGKQCFTPSIQLSGLRDGSLSPSPSPTRRTFLTRRRSQSPCLLRPSALGPIKRKYDSDSESCISPKRFMVTNNVMGNQEPNNQTNNFPPKTVIHRSHSLSSSSVDSDLNVSPSPPPILHNGFMGTGLYIQHKRNTSSPIQSPLCNTSLPVPTHERLCSSPTSSTCSSSSLEGIVPQMNQKNKNATPTINRVQPTNPLS